MAIDTDRKRRSVAGISVGWGMTPDSGHGDAWRLEVAWNYDGLDVAVVIPPLPVASAVLAQVAGPLARVYIHNPWGAGETLCELTTAHNITRSYARMQPGQTSLVLSREEPGLGNVFEGNLLVIESSEMSPWVGPILTIDEDPWTGDVQVNALGHAAILDGRETPQNEKYTSSIGSGLVARNLLPTANQRSHTGIYAGHLEVGPPIEDWTVGGQSLLEALNELSSRTDYEWWLEEDTNRKHVRTTLRWGFRQGHDHSADVHLWLGVHCSLRYRRDQSQVKQVTTVIGDFGVEVGDRNSVTRLANVGAARVDLGSSSYESSSGAAIRGIASMPAGLRNERSQFEVMTTNTAELSRRAKRSQERLIFAAEQFEVVANRATNWTHLRVGNYITIHGSLGTKTIDDAVRIVSVSPNEERGECALSCERAA